MTSEKTIYNYEYIQNNNILLGFSYDYTGCKVNYNIEVSVYSNTIKIDLKDLLLTYIGSTKWAVLTRNFYLKDENNNLISDITDIVDKFRYVENYIYLYDESKSVSYFNNLENGKIYKLEMRVILYCRKNNPELTPYHPLYNVSITPAHTINIGNFVPYTIPNQPNVISEILDKSCILNFTCQNNGRKIINYEYSIDNSITFIPFNPPQTSDSGSINIGDLINGVGYNISLRALNLAGRSIEKNIYIIPYKIPDAPIISSIVSGDKNLIVNFSPSLDDGGYPIINYEYSLNNNYFQQVIPYATTSPVKIINLVNDSNYSVKLRALNAIMRGSISNEITSSPYSSSSINVNRSKKGIYKDYYYTITSYNRLGSADIDITYEMLFFNIEYEVIPIENGIIVRRLINHNYQIIENDILSLKSNNITIKSSDNLSGVYEYIFYNLPYAEYVVSSSITLKYNIARRSLNYNFENVHKPNSSYNIRGIQNGIYNLPDEFFITSVIPLNNGFNIYFLNNKYDESITLEYSIDNDETFITTSNIINSNILTNNKLIISNVTNGNYNISIRGRNQNGPGLISRYYIPYYYNMIFNLINVQTEFSLKDIDSSNSKIVINFINNSQYTNYEYSIDNGTFIPFIITNGLTVTNLQNKNYKLVIRQINNNLIYLDVFVKVYNVPSQPFIEKIDMISREEISQFRSDCFYIKFIKPSNTSNMYLSYEYSLDNGLNYNIAYKNDINDNKLFVYKNMFNYGITYNIKIRALNYAGKSIESFVYQFTPTEIPRPVITSVNYVKEGSLNIVYIYFENRSLNSSVVINYAYRLGSIKVPDYWNVLSQTTSPLVFSYSSYINAEISIKSLTSNKRDSDWSNIVIKRLSTIPSMFSMLNSYYHISNKSEIEQITGRSDIFVLIYGKEIDNGGENITNYQYSIDNGNTYNNISYYDVGKTRFNFSGLYVFGIQNLVYNTNYNIYIRAVNKNGAGESIYPVNIKPFNVPYSPIITSLSENDKNFIVNFINANDAGSQITNYEYSIDNGITFTSLIPLQTSSPIKISNLVLGNTYKIRIRAINSAGKGSISDYIEGTFISFPGIIKINFTSSSNNNFFINFSCSDNGGTPIIKYEYTIDNWITINSVTSSPITIGNLIENEFYTFKIKAINKLGKGPETSLNFSLYSTPSVPVITNIITKSKELHIYFTPSLSNGSVITSYQYKVNTLNYTNAYINFIKNSNITEGISFEEWQKYINDGYKMFFIIKNLTNNVSYDIRMIAINNKGKSEPSSVYNATPQLQEPDPPLITKILSSDKKLILYYNEPQYNGDSPITEYEYSYEYNNNSIVKNIGFQNPIIIDNLENNVIYDIKIRAKNTINYSLYSSVKKGKPSNSLPTIPIINSIVGSNNKLVVNYQYDELISTENLYTLNDGETYNSIALQNPFTIYNLENDIQYSIKLVSKNNIGTTQKSIEMNGTPTIKQPEAPIVKRSLLINKNFFVSIEKDLENQSIIEYIYSIDNWQTYSSIGLNTNFTIYNFLTENKKKYNIQIRAKNSSGDGKITYLIGKIGNIKVYRNEPIDNGYPVINYEYSIDNGLNFYELLPPQKNNPIQIKVLIPYKNIKTVFDIRLRAININNFKGIQSNKITKEISIKPERPIILKIEFISIYPVIYLQSTKGISPTKFSYKYNNTYYDFDDSNILENRILLKNVQYNFSSNNTFEIIIRSSYVDNEYSFYSDDSLPYYYVHNTTILDPPNILNIIPNLNDFKVYFEPPQTTLPITSYQYSFNSVDFYNTDTISSPFTIKILTDQYKNIVFRSISNNIISPIEKIEYNSNKIIFKKTSESFKIGNVPFIKFIKTIYGNRHIKIILNVYDGNYEITNFKYSINNSSYVLFDPPQKISPIIIKDLENKVYYNIKLIAINSIGESDPLEVITKITEPLQPKIKNIIKDKKYIMININQEEDNGSNITNYKYSINNSQYISFNPPQFLNPIIIKYNDISINKVETIKLKSVNDIDESIESLFYFVS